MGDGPQNRATCPLVLLDEVAIDLRAAEVRNHVLQGMSAGRGLGPELVQQQMRLRLRGAVGTKGTLERDYWMTR